MHPRTREVRKPDSGIDPRGSGSGQPPLLQGFLKHRKPGATPRAVPTEATTAKAGSTVESTKAAGTRRPKPAPKAAPTSAATSAAKPRKPAPKTPA